jgi:hypothetical protein
MLKKVFGSAGNVGFPEKNLLLAGGVIGWFRNGE